jgi:glucokinase
VRAAPALLADIGGTNARFALLQDGRIGPPLVLPVAGFSTAEAAIAHALDQLAPEAPVDLAVLALAGPVVEEPVRLTNAAWTLGRAALAARFGLRAAVLVNDFEALAHALPHLAPADLLPIGQGRSEPGAPMLVLGPGTGLGCAALVPGPGGVVAVPTEGGHAGLAPADAEQDAVVAALRARCGRAGAEEALSGRGLAVLHAILAERRGVAVPVRDAASVLAAAPHCAVAAAAETLFLDLLAGFAGDMALAWGARGGVFLAGGILPRLAARLDAARFRARFEAKAPMGAYLARIPLAVVMHPAPAFPGLAALAGTLAG